jgi:repressor LexA
MYKDLAVRTLEERIEEKEQEILKDIISLISTRKMAPTIREIGKAAHMKSPSTTLAYMRRLRKKGYIDWLENKPRTLHILEQKKTSTD